MSAAATPPGEPLAAAVEHDEPADHDDEGEAQRTLSPEFGEFLSYLFQKAIKQCEQQTSRTSA